MRPSGYSRSGCQTKLHGCSQCLGVNGLCVTYMPIPGDSVPEAERNRNVAGMSVAGWRVGKLDRRRSGM